MLPGLPAGYEKWLLDLVALGTVCDIVSLQNENRANVCWGLEVLKKQRRPGLKALLAVAGVQPAQITARTLGFGLGPRMNAAGRLASAEYALDMLRARDGLAALEAAQQLDRFNTERKAIQQAIYDEACQQAERYTADPVLVVSQQGWNHGVIGIVASKLVEAYHKPVFIIGERGETATGSARSFGDFSAERAVRAADDVILRGGGHAAAAGVTLETRQIGAFRQRVNDYYRSLHLSDQTHYLLPQADVVIDDLSEVTEQLVADIARLEPFGNGNPEPVLRLHRGTVSQVRHMGSDGQHIKLTVQDGQGTALQLLAFNAPPNFVRQPGDVISAWFQPTINDWRGMRSVEGRLLHVELVDE